MFLQVLPSDFPLWHGKINKNFIHCYYLCYIFNYDIKFNCKLLWLKGGNCGNSKIFYCACFSNTELIHMLMCLYFFHFSGHLTLAGAVDMQTNAQPTSFWSGPFKLYGHTEFCSTVSCFFFVAFSRNTTFDSIIAMAGTTTAATWVEFFSCRMQFQLTDSAQITKFRLPLTRFCWKWASPRHPISIVDPTCSVLVFPSQPFTFLE